MEFIDVGDHCGKITEHSLGLEHKTAGEEVAQITKSCQSAYTSRISPLKHMELKSVKL